MSARQFIFLVLVFCLCTCGQLFAQDNALNKTISVDINNISRLDALDQIGVQAEISFAQQSENPTRQAGHIKGG